MPVPPHEGDRFEGQLTCPDCGHNETISLTLVARSPAAPSLPETIGPIDAVMLERYAAVAAQVDFPLYGLDRSWIGPRFLSGFGGVPVVERFTLGFGDPLDPESPLLRVETHRPSDPHDEVRPQQRHLMAARSLAREMTTIVAPNDAITATLRSKDPTASWAAQTLDVAGQAHEFRALQFEQAWAALGYVGDQLLAIEVRLAPAADIDLVVVDDLEPFVLGTNPA